MFLTNAGVPPTTQINKQSWNDPKTTLNQLYDQLMIVNEKINGLSSMDQTQSAINILNSLIAGKNELTAIITERELPQIKSEGDKV